MIQRIFTTTILILAFGLALPACQNRFTASQAGVDANDVPSRPYDVGVDSVVLRIRPGTTGSHYIEILNYGTQRDTYTITAPTPRSQRGWIMLTQPLPLTVTLDPEQRFQLPITFTVPMT